MGVRVVGVTARRGWSARRFVSSGAVPVLARGADVVIFELGGNDASQHIDPTQHRVDVQTLIGQARPAKVIWIGPGVTTRSDMEAFRHPLRAVQKGVLKGAGDVWIDSQLLTREADLRGDGVHYTMAGYDRWARLLQSKLAKAGVSTVPAWVGPALFAGMAVGAAALVTRGFRR